MGGGRLPTGEVRSRECCGCGERRDECAVVEWIDEDARLRRHELRRPADRGGHD